MKPEDIECFYKDMRNPHLTIHDVLVKYNTNLKEALGIIRGYNKYERLQQCLKEETDPEWRYIKKIGKKYTIGKWHKGHCRSFGTYHTFKEAQTIRDHMVKHGWDLENLDMILKEYGIEKSNDKRGRK